ncbi:hypothetical protein ACEPAI_10110 [Sanghuangporus weigelae]
MHETIIILITVLGLGVFMAYVTVAASRRRSNLPLPPGPKPKPIIGNLRDLPPREKQEWIHWAKHKELYGPISSVTTFGQTLIILNDQSIAFELFEKRSVIYSSRPRFVFGGEMVGWQNTLIGHPYTDRFRSYRKNFHAIIGTKAAVSRFSDLQDVEMRRFLLRVLEEPGRLLQHVQTVAGAIILKISHGYTIEPRDRDPLVQLADEVLEHFSQSSIAGAWLVDTLPFLRYLPEWLPGMNFKRTAALWRQSLTELVEKPFAFVKQQMAAGTNAPSYASALLAKGNLSPEEEDIIKWTSQSLYAGGSETTVASLQVFFLAMTAYPDVQRKAQEEIDRAVGNDRLPGIRDRENLPYIDAIAKEVLRWHPVGPLGFPHLSTEDDNYEGYFIPKGSIVIPNIWLFTHDPKNYHDPMTFKPERFLSGEPEMDPRSLIFGFGRRVCAGRELVDVTMFLLVAQSLAAFNINKPVENGKAIEPAVAFSAGTLSHPVAFRSDVRPRNEKAASLIKEVEVEYPFTPSDAKSLEKVKM